MDYKEMSKLIEKPWVDVNGIMKIAQCGKYSATRIRSELEAVSYTHLTLPTTVPV